MDEFKSLRAFGYALASTVGLGVLLLPKLFYEVGIIPALLTIASASVLLGLVAYMAFDLVDATSLPLDQATEKYLTFLKPLVPVVMALFTYGAISAYLVAAGIQMAYWIGFKQHYWTTLFFILLLVPIVMKKSIRKDLAVVFSLFLAFVIAFLIPISVSIGDKPIIPFACAHKIPMLFLASVFALFGFFSAKDLVDITGNKKKAEKMYLFAYLLAYAIYVFFAIAVARVIGNQAELSTALLSRILGGVYGAVVSIAALLAFYTPAIPISLSFMEMAEKRWRIKEHEALIFLFFPVAILYTLADYGLLTLSDLAIGLGGGSLLLFSILIAMANAELAKERKTAISTRASYAIAIVLLLPLILYILGP